LFKPSVILVRPQLPENIGMVSRVMNNFGFKELILVNPRKNWLNTKSINSAKKSEFILQNAKVYNSLDEALKKFSFVISTTNRNRDLEKNTTSSFISLFKIIPRYKKIAFIFGPENSGLSNEDLRLTDLIFTINTNKNSNSLNLSHAVSIMCHNFFEFDKIKLKNNQKINKNTTNKEELLKYFDFLFKNLESKNFFVPKEKTESMKNNIFSIYLNSSISKKQLQTLWGITKKLMK
tara:strand:- start:734 stop:1438 length:705 start_codon:yes stop_codon:yes gene_type:complete